MVGPPFSDPSQIDPVRARAIIAFLNAAATPEEIATAIEFPGEPDIGVRLAERLLRERDELGGFTDLRQIRSIRLIGPERFTEIVTALTERGTVGIGVVDPLEQLRDEIGALRARLAIGVMTSQRRLELRMVEPNVYLGQAVSITATLNDGELPAPDVPVTFVATRGELRCNDGYTTHQGHLITARTGFDGVVRLTALPTTTEELSPLQQDALSTALGLLDRAADTPAAAAAGLRSLAQQYAWEINLPLRQAIDIYVREFRPMLLDTVNHRENLVSWSFTDSALLAFAPVAGNGETGSSVSATATLHLRVRNWIPAFLEAFVNTAREESGLTEELRDISRNVGDRGRFVNDIYTRASQYVTSRWGNVGAYVGRKVAESSIRNVIDTDLNELPLETRVAVFPALDLASKTVAATDTRVLQALVGTRREMAEDVSVKTNIFVTEIAGAAGRLNNLEAAMAVVPQTQDLAILRSELLGSITATRSELFNAIGAIQPFLDVAVTQSQLQAALASKVDTTTFNAQMATKVDTTTFNSQLASKVDAGTFQTFQNNVNDQFTVRTGTTLTPAAGTPINTNINPNINPNIDRIR
jgi:hypothetical protein